MSRRLWAETFLLSLLWPFLAAVVHVLNYPRRRILIGFVVFCGFAGLAFSPTPGSDGDTYANRILGIQAGGGFVAAEPVPAVLINSFGFLGLGTAWYFMSLGLIYSFFVCWSAKLLFKDVPINTTLSLAAVVFVLALLLNNPVFAGLNARYHLGMAVLPVSALLMMDGRWRPALLVAFAAMMIHYGHVFFLGALTILLLSRSLGKWQIVMAYGLLVVAFLLPPNFMPELGKSIAPHIGGVFESKVDTAVRYAERTQFGEIDRWEGRPWFMKWREIPIFIALLITGHMLWWKVRHQYLNPYHQLWVLIIILWAFQTSMSGDPLVHARLQRSVTVLLLLFHAYWFLFRKKAATLVLLIIALPFALHFTVAYRRWLHQVGLETFTLGPFVLFGDDLPRILQIIGFD